LIRDLPKWSKAEKIIVIKGTLMKMIPVTSSAIKAVGYDPDSNRLFIEFKQGETYTYCRVPENIFKSILSTHSPGSFYYEHIKDKYNC
jgi:hypothetical protein